MTANDEAEHRAVSYADFPQWYMYPPKPSYVPAGDDDSLTPALRGLSGATNLYVHVPFCNMRCTFCTLFASTGAHNDSIERYVHNLLNEIELMSSRVDAGEVKLTNVYFGGGTPSILSPASIGQIFEKIKSKFLVDSKATISVEFSPDTVNKETADRWRSMGATCASLGVQCFEDNLLAKMRRNHNSDGSLRAIDRLRSAGFTYVNIDLIYGHHSQDENTCKREIDTAIKSGATRVTLYPLAVRGKPALAVQEKKGLFRAQSDATYRSLHLAAIRQFRAAGWSMTSALSFSSNGIGNAFEESEADGSPTLGVGVGARTYTRTIHVSSIPTVGKPNFGLEVDKYYDAIARTRLRVAAAVELCIEEQVRRQVILRIVGRGLPKVIVDRIEIDELRRAIENEIARLREEELLHTNENAIFLTDEGILRAAEVGFRLASKNVQQRLLFPSER